MGCGTLARRPLSQREVRKRLDPRHVQLARCFSARRLAQACSFGGTPRLGPGQTGRQRALHFRLKLFFIRSFHRAGALKRRRPEGRTVSFRRQRPAAGPTSALYAEGSSWTRQANHLQPKDSFSVRSPRDLSIDLDRSSAVPPRPAFAFSESSMWRVAGPSSTAWARVQEVLGFSRWANRSPR